MTLTREEILAMEPGKELDELICTHIFELEMVAHVHYSTDISAAWEVYEQFSEISVKRYNSGHGHHHVCQIEIAYGVGKLAVCDTAPEAICKAALLARLNL